MRLRQREHAVAGGVDRDRQVAAALDPAEVEHLAEAALEIDVGELQLRLEVGAEVGARRAPSEPLRMPPNACDSPIVTVSLPPRRLVAMAVRPSLARAIVMRAADSRRSRSKPFRPSSAIGSSVPVALVGGEQADGGDIGREIELVGGERALQRLPAVGGEGEHALGDVAVELDIDGGERDRSAGDAGLGLEREAAEAAAGAAASGRPSATCRAARRHRPRACLRSSASAACSSRLRRRA